MDSDALNLETLDIITPDHYQKNGYPHREWAHLRKHAPVFWYDRSNVEPFWAITKHADIIEIARQPKSFINRPRLLIALNDPAFQPGENLFRHLLNMDPPEHGKYRDLVNRRFTPRAVRELESEVDHITRTTIEQIASRSRNGSIECDFVTDIAARVPLDVIAAQIGVPREDREQLFRWTNETIGSGDPEFQDGSTPKDTLMRAREGLFTYFNNLVEERRREPKDDLTTVLVQGRLDGQPLPTFELMSYFLLLVVAGNETTRNATTGGLLAFIENPAQWNLLRKNPELIKSAVEEVVRWTSPVIQFARTATVDYELRGQTIKAGQSLGLFYPSANRDEEVFEQPFKFDITRDPNPHLAFGIGEHFCLGANLARLELEVIFKELIRWLDHAELTGEVERLRSSFVGGIKHMPVRLQLSPQ
ncbi:MAG: cytochrome P450 [Candidatus Binataceae bacterium]